MASKSEVGHARNVANFQDLIAFVNGYGATYDPSKTVLNYQSSKRFIQMQPQV
jgi:hypothetical protein